MTVSQAFDLALQRHRAGRLADAEALCRQILALQPNHTDALHQFGMIAFQTGRIDEAIVAFRRALELNPNNFHTQTQLGIALARFGRLDEAIAAFRSAVRMKPDSPEAHNNLGNALRESGRSEEAAVACRLSFDLNPDFAEAHVNLGAALAAQGKIEKAIAAYRRALEIKPDLPHAHNNLANVLRAFGQFDEAVVACRRALELDPRFPEAHNNLGASLARLGQLDEAIAAYQCALQFKPAFPETLNNLGDAFLERGKLDEAVAACQRALELRPDFPEAWNNLGNALRERGQLDEAIEAFQRALKIKPDYPSAHSNLVYTLHFHPGHDASTISEEHQRWNRQFSDSVKPFAQGRHSDFNPERRLRVGYVSPDFRDHPVGRYLLPLFERHDRARFKILCYTDVMRSDWMTERFRSLAGGWRNTVGLPDVRLAEMIREDEVDILVDLAMHTAHNRLTMFARQPAPVQVTWLGYPGSTGLPSIGYRLTDAFMEPLGTESAWSAEKPARLPDCWCCYQPVGECPEINELPALSTGGVTFGSLNNFAKVNPRVLACWARVLKAVKGSRLLMSCPEGRSREQVQAFLGAQGITPARVKFASRVPRWEYLGFYQQIDLELDPFPCNGMTTTCDALWMGVPVLTLPGATPVSRAGLSLLSTVGLQEFAASSEDDYVGLAVKLAADLPRLVDLRASLRARMLASALMDAPRFARNVEAAYREMWRRWCEAPSPLADKSDKSDESAI